MVAADAILTHLPLDTFAEAAAYRMAVVGDPRRFHPSAGASPNW